MNQFPLTDEEVAKLKKLHDLFMDGVEALREVYDLAESRQPKRPGRKPRSDTHPLAIIDETGDRIERAHIGLRKMLDETGAWPL